MYQVKDKHSACGESLTVNETVRLVELCADQINAAVEEAFREIDALTRSVLNTTRYAGDLLGALSDQTPDSRLTTDSVLSDSKALRQVAEDSIVRLQFADRLNQRLLNVSKNLTGLAEFMQSTDLPISDINRTAFLEETRATFTIKQERQMFDAKFGASVPGAESPPDENSDPTLFDGGVRDGRCGNG